MSGPTAGPRPTFPWRRPRPARRDGGDAPAAARTAAGNGGAGRLAAVAAGLLLDRAAGEPPSRAHPVAAFGSAMLGLDARLWRDDRRPGVVFAAAGTAAGAAAGVAAVAAAGTAVGTALVAWLTVAGRALAEEAGRVGAALAAGDAERARALLPALVGRDPDALDEKGIARAVVESVAENTVDAVVAPAVWGALLGAPGAGAYRAVNTLDAMVGHRNGRYRRFGWASARLDDAANWLPARLTALLVAAVRPAAAPQVLRALRHPPALPSPNAAVSEAAFAAALGVRLGGDAVYDGRVDPRPEFGTGRPAEAGDIEAAVRLSRDVTLALAGALALAGWLTRRRGAPGVRHGRTPAFGPATYGPGEPGRGGGGPEPAEPTPRNAASAAGAPW